MSLIDQIHIAQRNAGEDAVIRHLEEQGLAQIAAINPTQPQHPDDQAVDRFAAAMKEKLAKAREKGRSGWETCSPDDLSRMLRDHVEKGDPRDVANFSMMLWNLGAGIAATTQPAPPPECQTKAERTAYAFGWFQALESVHQTWQRDHSEMVNRANYWLASCLIYPGGEQALLAQLRAIAQKDLNIRGQL